MSTGAHPPEIEARQQLVTGLLRWLYSLESGETWTERLLTVLPTASGQVRYELTERREAADLHEVDVLSEGVGEAVRALQQNMYTPAGGAWLTAELSVTSEGKGDARFNYGREPQIPGADGGAAGLSDEEIEAHLRTFPRPAETLPGWMRTGD